MIDLPNYDDQSFEDIVEMAKQRIPVIYPQWTDMNEHDPGITILELFAWLKEMQQYHLNRITVSGYESMLGLLGAAAREAAAAKTCIVLPDISTYGTLPRGMRLETPGNIIFECNDAVRLNSFKIQSIYVNDSTGFIDVQNIIREPGIYCHAFGDKPVEGVSALYIGTDYLVRNQAFNLFLQLDDSYPVQRNPFREESIMPGNIVWEYGVSGKEGLKFIQVEEVNDKTFGFSCSGTVTFKIEKEACRESLGEGLPECCWLRARLINKGCEENPRIADIFKDMAHAEQKKTLCECNSLTLTENKRKATFELRTWLALTGRYIIFVRDILGWSIYNEAVMNIQVVENEKIAVFKLANLPEDIALDGASNIRVLCYEADFAGSMILSGSNGLPCQRFPLQLGDELLREQLSIMVYEETEEGHKRWIDWSYTPKLAGAGAYDRCFTYDRTTGELLFGDNEQGAVPQAGENNIIVTGCVITRGSVGNIDIQKFEPLEYGNIRTIPYNPAPASGGRDAENIRGAIERMKASLKQCVKAVTVTDYESLVASTPGLRLLGVKAIPFYDPDRKVVGDKQAPATVTVVVLPYNEGVFPMPDNRFLETVSKQLENFRLITTRVKVIGPSYIKISIYTEIVLEDIRRENMDGEIKAAIETYFELVRKGTPGGRPEFGQPVRESILSIKIGAIPGVAHVKKVTLGVRDSDSYRDKYGNIIIPPNGLPFPGDIQIRTLL